MESNIDYEYDPEMELHTDPVAFYGGLDGPDSMYVKLISDDDFEFIIKREYPVSTSQLMKDMLERPAELQFRETWNNEIKFGELSSHVLDIVCRYCLYRCRYNNSSLQAPDFFIEPNASLDVLMAANFLEC